MLNTEQINEIQSLLRREMGEVTNSIQSLNHLASNELVQEWIDKVHRLEVIHDELNKLREDA